MLLEIIEVPNVLGCPGDFVRMLLMGATGLSLGAIVDTECAY